MAREDRKRYGWLWAGALFFSAGYVVTALGTYSIGPARAPATRASVSAPATAAAPGRTSPLRSPVYATAALVALTIPYARRAPRMLAGALRGLWAGSAGAAGIALGLTALAGRVGPEPAGVAASLAALGALICCTATGAVFGLVAEKRTPRARA